MKVIFYKTGRNDTLQSITKYKHYIKKKYELAPIDILMFYFKYANMFNPLSAKRVPCYAQKVVAKQNTTVQYYDENIIIEFWL